MIIAKTVLLGSLTIGAVTSMLTSFAQALPASPEMVAVSFLSGTGVSGFVIWWGATRVVTRQDAQTEAIHSLGTIVAHELGKTRDRISSKIQTLGEIVVEAILVHDMATESAKRIAAEKLKELKVDDSTPT